MTDPDFLEASTGIVNPTMVTLRPGETICRFADKSGEPAASPWWMSAGSLQKLMYQTEADPDRARMGLKFAARTRLAVRGEWSSMSRIVVAKVVARVNVWAGRGRTIRDTLPNGMVWTFKTPKDLTQLHIPGLRGQRGAAGMNAVKIQILQILDVPPSNISYFDAGRG